MPHDILDMIPAKVRGGVDADLLSQKSGQMATYRAALRDALFLGTPRSLLLPQAPLASTTPLGA